MSTTPQELSNAALLKAAAAAAKSDLYAMARQGLLEFGHQRFEYSTSIFDSYRSFGGDYLYDLKYYWSQPVNEGPLRGDAEGR
jgi:hypothetical protein